MTKFLNQLRIGQREQYILLQLHTLITYTADYLEPKDSSMASKHCLKQIFLRVLQATVVKTSLSIKTLIRTLTVQKILQNINPHFHLFTSKLNLQWFHNLEKNMTELSAIEELFEARVCKSVSGYRL